MNYPDGHRLAECWKHQDCGSCLRSTYKCGWCATVSYLYNLVTSFGNQGASALKLLIWPCHTFHSTCGDVDGRESQITAQLSDSSKSSSCVPASSILEPVKNADVCPYYAGRWELRTSTFGCHCSTITLLSVLVTIACTIVGLVVIYGILKLVASVNRVWGTGSLGGWSVEIDSDGQTKGGIWYRPRTWLPRRLTRGRIRLDDEDE